MPEPRLTSAVVWATRSRTKTPLSALKSSGCMFDASDANATRRPSPEIEGADEAPLPFAPSDPPERLTSAVVLAARSRTKTSEPAPVSSGSRFEASDAKLTARPSAETLGALDAPLPFAPPAPAARLTSVVVAF